MSPSSAVGASRLGVVGVDDVRPPEPVHGDVGEHPRPPALQHRRGSEVERELALVHHGVDGVVPAFPVAPRSARADLEGALAGAVGPRVVPRDEHLPSGSGRDPASLHDDRRGSGRALGQRPSARPSVVPRRDERAKRMAVGADSAGCSIARRLAVTNSQPSSWPPCSCRGGRRGNPGAAARVGRSSVSPGSWSRIVHTPLTHSRTKDQASPSMATTGADQVRPSSPDRLSSTSVFWAVRVLVPPPGGGSRTVTLLLKSR